MQSVASRGRLALLPATPAYRRAAALATAAIALDAAFASAASSTNGSAACTKATVA